MVRDGVVEAARVFFGNMEHKDDITMVIGKFYEPGTAPPLRQEPTVEQAEEEEEGEPSPVTPEA